MSHTEGPWYVEPPSLNLVRSHNENGDMVASTHRMTPKWQANARLIAEAPAMLEFITKIAAYPDWEGYPIEPRLLGREARAIIERAEGEA